jgi:hypothetical protein
LHQPAVAVALKQMLDDGAGFGQHQISVLNDRRLAERMNQAVRARRSYRLGNRVGVGKDSRSRCSDVLGRVVCSDLSAFTSVLLTGTISSFSAFDEAMFSA